MSTSTFFVWLWATLSSVINTLRLSLTTILPSRLVVPHETRARPAETYEGWKRLQAQLDSRHNVREWALNDEDASYDWPSLRKLKEDLEACRQRKDALALRSKLRAQATRNCCSMLSPRLFLKSQIQTKKLVHDYVREVRRCIEWLSRAEAVARPEAARVDEDCRRHFGDVGQILGRTTLVLQGGAMVSLCHLGVVKALRCRGLLPRIITATGTGALVAAIVGCTPDDRLLAALDGSSINIDAFVRSREVRLTADARSSPLASWVRAIVRRTARFWRTGHFFEIDTLARCVRDNIGDVTFEEAFNKSGRILNITIAKPDVGGTPQLLNYITAPHVVVWSAVAASVATSKSLFAAAPLQCKNDVGIIVRYFAVDSAATTNPRRRMPNPRIPMERIGELFDVNHYIVSQTRPYIIPFVRMRDSLGRGPIGGAIIKVIYCEVLHRLDALNRLGLLPTYLQRVLIDEDIPSTSSWSKFVIAPELSFLDYFRIFNFPSPKVIDSWAMKGERSVWPHVCQIRLRCGIEFENDAAYRREAGRPRPQTVASYR